MGYGFPADLSSANPSHELRHDFHWWLELLQLRFDGQRLLVTRREALEEKELLPDWRVTARGLGMAVPSGEGFLYGLVAGPADGPEIPHWHPHCEPGLGRNLGSGVSRWECGPTGWRPVNFQNLSGADLAFEPSLVRAADGALYLTVRGKGSNAPPGELDDGLENTYEHFRVWRSTDEGVTWESVLHLPQQRAPTPVVINRTASGQPYLSANPYFPIIERDSLGKRVAQQMRREHHALWALGPEGRSLASPVIVFDGPKVLGPAQQPPTMQRENRWFLDHPIGAVLRLGDGQWHALQAMRMTDAAGTSEGAELARGGGTWVEEVSDGLPAAALPWTFAGVSA